MLLHRHLLVFAFSVPTIAHRFWLVALCILRIFAIVIDNRRDTVQLEANTS